MDRIEMETHEAALNTLHETQNLIPPNIDVGAVSRECTRTLLDERKPKENPAEQHFLSGTQHLYQQINNGESLSREHEYQSLLRENGEMWLPTNDPFETAQKHATSNVNHEQQGSEYQQLHLYSRVEEK
ncbi:uncharacterized protein LOC116293458 [Actinia tenebrosa]|uniref:Uncharacterized protein LOC116293458 n=1 Tax=Actinia tenebrosa TaxID=6105 RepID=A0A6P8HLY6_ACTTE|nr:uncharacterized protein LOC116293458 [Actinia tenebrosa]